MMQQGTNRETRPRHLRSFVQEQAYYSRLRERRALILTGAAGLAVGAIIFLGLLFAAMPQAPAARVVGADDRIIGIPKNCDEARAAQIAPMARGSGFYNPKLDNNSDGLACEKKKFGVF